MCTQVSRKSASAYNTHRISHVNTLQILKQRVAPPDYGRMKVSGQGCVPGQLPPQLTYLPEGDSERDGAVHCMSSALTKFDAESFWPRPFVEQNSLPWFAVVESGASIRTDESPTGIRYPVRDFADLRLHPSCPICLYPPPYNATDVKTSGTADCSYSPPLLARRRYGSSTSRSSE